MFGNNNGTLKLNILRGLLVCSLVFCVIFSGCSLPNSTESTLLSIDESGTLTQTIIEAKAEDEFTEEELTAYVQESVDAYNGETGDGIALDSCAVNNDTVKIVMTYKTAEDYAAFNGMDCFMGTISEAEEAGYDLSDATLLDPDGNDADRSIIAQRADEWKVIILGEDINVKAPDKILYLSDNVELTGRMTATVHAVNEEGTTTESVKNYASSTEKFAYIIYK